MKKFLKHPLILTLLLALALPFAVVLFDYWKDYFTTVYNFLAPDNAPKIAPRY